MCNIKLALHILGYIEHLYQERSIPGYHDNISYLHHLTKKTFKK